MSSQSYFPNYYSIEDILVTQDKVACQVNSRMLKMGFLDPQYKKENLEQGKKVKLPLWYVKELKVNNPYLTILIPEMYKNVYNAVCEADSTYLELGKVNSNFYELGRYLAPYDRNHTIGKIIYDICRQRVRQLLITSKNTAEEVKPVYRMDSIESQLYDVGIKTTNQFTNWLQQKNPEIKASELVQEHMRKRKRFTLSDDEMSTSPQTSKRSTLDVTLSH